MTLRLRSALPCALLLGGLLLAFAAPRDGDDVVHESMETLKAQLKIVGRTVADPAAAEQTLAALVEMQRALLDAKQASPPEIETLAESKRAAHAKGFRLAMNRTLSAVLDLEALVLDGDHEGAEAMVKGRLLELRNDSHDRYQPPLTSGG